MNQKVIVPENANENANEMINPIKIWIKISHRCWSGIYETRKSRARLPAFVISSTAEDKNFYLQLINYS